MVALVVLLAATNLITLLLLAAHLWRRRARPGDVEVFEAPRPAGVSERERRLITIEILNPIELATARGGRVASLAGTIAPGFTRRFVYEQTLRTLRQELRDKDVLADVRVHSLRSAPQQERPTRRPNTVDVPVVDQVAPLDLGDAPP